MLNSDQWKEALQNADKVVNVCNRFCRTGATVENGQAKVWHNGVGNLDTSEQVVFSDGTLQLGQSPLTEILSAWLTNLHQHKRYDLNTRAEVDKA